MTPLQVAISWAVRVAMVALFAGLVVRRRASLCWSFPAYLVAINVGGTLPLLWPLRFYTPEFWMVKQSIYDALKLAVALELAWRAVRTFGGAARVARHWALAILGSSLVLILLGPNPREMATWWEWQARAQIAVMATISLTGVLVAWYRLPVHLWHRAVLLGFAPYLVVHALLADLLKRDGWGMAWWFGVLDASAYLLLTCWWAVAAWWPEREVDGVPEPVLRRLGMERA